MVANLHHQLIMYHPQPTQHHSFLKRLNSSIHARSYRVFTSACSHYEHNDVTTFLCRYFGHHASILLVRTIPMSLCGQLSLCPRVHTSSIMSEWHSNLVTHDSTCRDVSCVPGFTRYSFSVCVTRSNNGCRGD